MTVENTYLGDAISSIDQNKINNDEAAKTVLADKNILSRILKGTMKELADSTIEEVISAIGDKIEISSRAVNTGLTNVPRELGTATEDGVNGEGTVKFDIRTHVYLPNQDIKILINIEAQKDFHPGYDIETRAVWYCARMLSSELNVEFSNKNNDPKKYANIKKVYSIWVVLDPPQYLSGKIMEYSV